MQKLLSVFVSNVSYNIVRNATNLTAIKQCVLSRSEIHVTKTEGAISINLPARLNDAGYRLWSTYSENASNMDRQL